MELLQEYDALSNTNNINVLGIDLIDEYPEQWEYLNSPAFKHFPTRLMAWAQSAPADWYPIVNHGTLFLGIVDSPDISTVNFKWKGEKECSGILRNGYWRPSTNPIPLDSMLDDFKVQVTSVEDKFEIAWLIINSRQDQKIFSKMDPKDFLV